MHTESYKRILSGEGFGIKDAEESINIVYNIRNSNPVGLKADYHPLCKNLIKK